MKKHSFTVAFDARHSVTCFFLLATCVCRNLIFKINFSGFSAAIKFWRVNVFGKCVQVKHTIHVGIKLYFAFSMECDVLALSFTKYEHHTMLIQCAPAAVMQPCKGNLEVSVSSLLFCEMMPLLVSCQ